MSARPVLGLRKAPEPESAEAVQRVPVDAPVSFLNWRVGSRRPSRRYLTAEEAFTEAKRIREASPGATVQTYRLELLGSNGGAL